MSDREPFPDGVTEDADGTLHIDVVAVLAGWGIEPTPHNVERATAYLLNAAHELLPEASAEVWPDD